MFAGINFPFGSTLSGADRLCACVVLDHFGGFFWFSQ